MYTGIISEKGWGSLYIDEETEVQGGTVRVTKIRAITLETLQVKGRKRTGQEQAVGSKAGMGECITRESSWNGRKEGIKGRSTMKSE